VPIGQNLDYDYPAAQSLLQLSTLASLALLIAILLGALHLRKSNPLLCFAILWFFLALSVESSFLPLYNVIAEHRLYLPMAGYSMVLVGGLYSISGEKHKNALIAFLCVYIGLLGFMTYKRNSIWQQGRIWEDVVQKSPGNARAHNNLGNWYKSQNRIEDAIREYKLAIETDPTYFGAYNNLGIIYHHQNRMEEAIRCYARVLTLDPNNPEAHNNLGIAYAKLGLLDQAIKIFRKGLESAPEDANLHSNLGLAYLKKGEFREAVLELKKALELNPDNEKAGENLRRVEDAIRRGLIPKD
jgi:tetratricopeptide (TPR) repeat protein